MYTNPEEQRRYQKEWLAARRKKFFSDKTCIDCGSTENLEIDHNDPSQKVSHRIWSWSFERREEELGKCSVRCHRCHSYRHQLHRPQGTQWVQIVSSFIHRSRDK